MMPGQLLHRLARRLCPVDIDAVFEPLVADLQREWLDTPAGSNRFVALARGYSGFWQAMTWCVGRSLVRGAVSPFDRAMAARVVLAFGGGLLGVIGLRVAESALGLTGIPIFGNSWGYWHRSASDIALGEFQTLGWSVVFAMVPAFMLARGHADRRWNATTSRLLIAGLAIALLCVGWVGPWLFHASLPHTWDQAGNPYFETLPALLRHTGMRAADAISWQRVLYGRLAFIADAGLLGLIGWQLGGIARPSPGRAAFWWFALMELVLLSGGFSINRAVSLQWVPTLALAAILIALRFAPKRVAQPSASIARL